MADGYLEKRYDEVYGKDANHQGVRHGVPLDTLLIRNRSCRGYQTGYVVTEDQLKKIVQVNTVIPSARNQQVLRFKIVTKDTGASEVLRHIRLGGALPELHLPLPGTEPEAFILICSTVPESRYVDMDLGISVQSMLLKAVDMGLNGIAIGAFNKDAIRDLFRLPYEPLLIVAIGKGAEHIVTVPIAADEDHAYYRKGGIHYVPKVRLEDLLLTDVE